MWSDKSFGFHWGLLRFIGRAIAIWGGNHINIHNVTAHHCPNSGIRVDQGDYVALTDNRHRCGI